MRVIRTLIVAVASVILLGGISCSTAKIPTDIQKAKESVSKKTREIEAIINYHELESPFLVRDTIVFNTPIVRRTLEFPVNIDGNLQLVYDKYILPIAGENPVLEEGIKNEVANIPVSYSYQDSLISIDITGTLKNVKIDYVLKPQELKKPIEYEKYDIDTKVKWHENDRLLRRILAILVAIIVIMILVLFLKNRIKIPFL